MFLPLRLKTIGDLIKPGEKVADVGADHGLLELYLIGRNKGIEIVAIENKRGPYNNLKKTVGALKDVRLSLSNGLVSVDKDVTTIVLAGMGGLNIKSILDERPNKLINIKNIVIDAHRDIDIARKTIVNYGFKIAQEIIVFEEEKFYVITSFEKDENHQSYSDDELEFGYKIYEDKLWPKYKESLIKHNVEVIKKIKNKPDLQDKVLKLRKINERLENYGKN